jgi:hypothetical protein
MTASGAPVGTEYDALAPYYDAFTAASDYEAWASHVLALARRHGLRGRAHSEGRGSVQQVGLDVQRERLAQLDELAGSLGWERASSGEPDSGSGARQLDAPADLLHDAFYGALIDAGERLAVTASTSWRGELPLGARAGGGCRGAGPPPAAAALGVAQPPALAGASTPCR